MAFEYEIDNKNVVRIWVNKETDQAPLILQPHYPDGSKWGKEQAIAWAESYCSYANDPSYPYIPAIGPNDPPRLKPVEPTPEELDAIAAEASGAAVIEETPAE